MSSSLLKFVPSFFLPFFFGVEAFANILDFEELDQRRESRLHEFLLHKSLAFLRVKCCVFHNMKYLIILIKKIQ
jgi:hypothetical protein